jgi:DHA2 family multidrug resistance protein
VIFGFFIGALLFSTTALLPTFMQNLLGYSALLSGITSVPRGIGSLISFLAVPWLVTRFGARLVLSTGVVLCVVATWQMSQFDLSMTPGPIMTSGLVQGLGTGLMFAPLNVLGYATLAAGHRTEGTIVATMARSLGSSAGISIVEAMLIRDSSLAHARIAERLSAGDPVVQSALPAMMNPATSSGLQILNGEVTRQGSMISYDNIFSWMALSVILLLPLVFLLKPAPAAPPSPDQAVHAD